MGTRAAEESDTLTRPYTSVPNWDPDTKHKKQYMSKTASDTNLTKVLTCGLRLRLRRAGGPKKRGRDLIGGVRRGGAPSEGGGGAWVGENPCVQIYFLFAAQRYTT